MHHTKKPSPTTSKRLKDPNKQPRYPPRVIHVNRDVATMVDEVSRHTDMQDLTSNESTWTPDGELPPFRPRTFSDSFLRNSSEELLLGVGCDACGHPPSPRYQCQQPWNKTYPTETSIDLLCNCNSENSSFLPQIPSEKSQEKLISDFEKLKTRHSYVKTNNSYHRSLDRKHVKTKSPSVVSFLPRHIAYADPNSSFVKKIKRNLSTLKRIGGDGCSKKNNLGLPLSEIPLDFSQRKSDSLAKHFKISDRDFSTNCIFSSSNFVNNIPPPDFINCNVSNNFDYPPETRKMLAQSGSFKRKNGVHDNEMTGIHKAKAINVSSINVTLDDRNADRFCSDIRSNPRRIMSYNELWKEGMLSGYSATNEPISYANYDGREPTVETIEGGFICRGAGRSNDARVFKRGDESECDMIMLETKQNLAGYHHCLCDNHTQSLDKKRSAAYFHSQSEKGFPPAPDVTAWTGVGGTTRLTGVVPRSGPQQVSTVITKSTPPWPTPTSQSSSVTGSSSRLNMRSRQWSLVVALVLVAGAAGVAGPIALRASAGAPLAERLEIANQLLHETPLIDGHNDLPWNIRKFLHNRLKDFKFDEDLRTIPPWSTSPWSHTDLPRMKQGRISAQFWAAYVPCDSQHRDAVQLAFEQIDLIRRLTDRYQPSLTLCTTAEDIREAHASQRMCSLVGVEGGHALGGSLGVLRTLYRVGVRYLTLTSTCNTPWADCALSDSRAKPEHGGLTAFGKLIVKEMNRLGIIVDLSHVSIKTMKDAIAVSKAPVIFSHSSAHAICNSSRNVPDNMLKRVAANRGLVMVNFYSKFLTCNTVATVQDAIAHINHIREVAGVDNVGLGAGYDGINYTPRGLEDVSSYPLLFAELMANGWSIEELKKLAGLNLLRVMEAVEKVSEDHKAMPPYEETMQPRPPDPHNCSSQDLF